MQAKLTADEINASDQIPTHVREATSDFWACDRCRKVTARGCCRMQRVNVQQ
jgi:uncharacterized protein with PIN domain